MAHFTLRFRQRILYPSCGILAAALLLPLPVAAAVGSHHVVLASPLLFAFVGWMLRRWAIVQYRSITLVPGIFPYVAGKEPADWHQKMGYLRLLEVMTLPSRRVNLYRRCGAKIGRGVVLAGTIAEPALTDIGARVVIGGNAIITAHEIRLSKGELVLKLAPVAIGEGCVVGGGSIVLAGSNVAARTMIPALTVYGRAAPSSATSAISGRHADPNVE